MSSGVIWFEGRRPAIEELEEERGKGLHGHLGMEVVDCGDDWLRMRMPVDARTHQPFGRLHGGASVALAETVGSIAANHCIDRGKRVAVGQEINANHIRPAYDGWVYATARPEALGRSSQVWSIRIQDEAGRLVCISRFTVALIDVARR
jgi:1,4-dihydroxy-2-naphthoyl-CoA hydrolase